MIVCVKWINFYNCVAFWCLLQSVLTDCNSLFPTYLYHSVTSDWYSPWQPNRLFQSDTVSSEQSVGDNSLIQLWYHTCIRLGAVTGLWRFCVCKRSPPTTEVMGSSPVSNIWSHVGRVRQHRKSWGFYFAVRSVIGLHRSDHVSDVICASVL